jgi:hypothetical protein
MMRKPLSWRTIKPSILLSEMNERLASSPNSAVPRPSTPIYLRKKLNKEKVKRKEKKIKTPRFCWVGGRKTKKNAPRGGLRRSKHASERGLGAGSSLAPSLACRRLSGCRGANGFGSPRICPGRCHSASVRRVCPLDADAPVNGCFIDSPSLSLVKH